MQIVIITLLAHPRIFFEGKILRQPIHHGENARIVTFQIGVNITQQTRVTDTAVGTQRDFAAGVRF